MRDDCVPKMMILIVSRDVMTAQLLLVLTVKKEEGKPETAYCVRGCVWRRWRGP